MRRFFLRLHEGLFLWRGCVRTLLPKDSGFAPNPFGGLCTLAHCTPNHMNVHLDKGDWLAGFLSKSEQNRFLYAMEVEEVIPLDCYFLDERFESKRPKSSFI